MPLQIDPGHLVTSAAQLDALYAEPSERSLQKVTPRLTPAYRRFIELSPFVILATHGDKGIDCSPRGDPAGFVHAVDDETLVIPDRRGNNRLDTLRNLLVRDAIGLIFLLPGANETLRVRGRASLVSDPALCARYAVDGKLPATVTVVRIEEVYFQCARALLRSRLWRPDAVEAGKSAPTAGEFLNQATGGQFDGKAYDAGAGARLKDSLY